MVTRSIEYNNVRLVGSDPDEPYAQVGTPEWEELIVVGMEYYLNGFPNSTFVFLFSHPVPADEERDCFRVSDVSDRCQAKAQVNHDLEIYRRIALTMAKKRKNVFIISIDDWVCPGGICRGIEGGVRQFNDDSFHIHYTYVQAHKSNFEDRKSVV